MRAVIAAAYLWVLLSLAIAPPATAMSDQDAAIRLADITWYTEEYPPYSFKKDGRAAGMAVDILVAAFRNLNVPLTHENIHIVPWNRSYKYLQKRRGTALFPMTYTPARRKIMKFVGPAVDVRISVIAPKAKELGKIDDAKLNGLRIGVVRDDIGDQLIRQFPLSTDQIQRKNSMKQLMYLLKSGRVDAVSYSAQVFAYGMKTAGDDPDAYEEVRILKEGKMGYAFHNGTNPAVLAALQNTIDTLRASGEIDKIIGAYQ